MFLLLLSFVHQEAHGCHHKAEDEERAGGQHEDQDVVFGGDELEAQNGTGTQNLTDSADERQRNGEADAHTETVKQ